MGEDIVIRPRLGLESTGPQEEMASNRAKRQAGIKRGIVAGVMARAAQLRTYATLARAVATPLGGLAAAIAVGAALAVRINTGKTFEALGFDVADYIFGDTAQVRGTADARQAMLSSPEIARVAGLTADGQGQVGNPQVLQLFEGIREQEVRKRAGEEQIKRQFPNANTADLAVDKFLQWWKRSGVEEELDRARDMVQAVVGGSIFDRTLRKLGLKSFYGIYYPSGKW